MEEKHHHNFLIGFIIATLAVFLYWYWSKATSSENGALDLLNRYAGAEARVRDLEREVGVLREQQQPAAASQAAAIRQPTPEPLEAAEPADFRQIQGIGPVYAQRLHDAGITTFAQLAGQSPDRLREVTKLAKTRAAEAEDWIAAARRLAG